MFESLERVRLAATRMGHAVIELAEWNAGPDSDYQEGDRLFQREWYEEAESWFLKLASDLKSRPRTRGRQAKALVMLAQVQRKLGKLKEAIESAESARQLYATRDRASSAWATCLDLLGSLQEENQAPDDARVLFRRALETEEKVVPVDPLALIQRCRRLAKALANVDESETGNLLNRAVELAEKHCGTHAPATAECLMELGKHQMGKGEKDTGISSMERAVEIHRQLCGSASDEVARDLECLASACHMAGELEKAVQYYERALSIRERQVGGNTGDLAVLMMALADVQSLLGNDGGSLELLQQAVGKLTGTNDEYLPWALEGLGVGYSRSGRFDDAASCYRKARVLWEKQPDANREMLEANDLRLQEALRYSPAQNVPSVPIFTVEAWSRHKNDNSVAPEGMRRQTSGPKAPKTVNRQRPAGHQLANMGQVTSGSEVFAKGALNDNDVTAPDGELFVTSDETPHCATGTEALPHIAPNVFPISANREHALPTSLIPDLSRLIAPQSIPQGDDNLSGNGSHTVVPEGSPGSPITAGGARLCEISSPVLLVVPANSASNQLSPASRVTNQSNQIALYGWDELAFDLLPSNPRLVKIQERNVSSL